jgi:two-component system response regulator YesN
MMNVFIADDEAMIREGLKFIIDWKELGFSICGEAGNGEDALKGILELEPELVLLDIQMPKLSGTEIVQLARENNFKGHFIILSGFTHFKYAQTAIRYGVNFYLTKPIDEDELYQAVNTVKTTLLEEQKQTHAMKHYFEKAKDAFLCDILLNNSDLYTINIKEIGLAADVYQVIIYENYSQESGNPTYSFADLLRVSSQGYHSFEHIRIHQKDTILLKGGFAIERFQDFLRHYKVNPQKGSPLDSLFITYGRQVKNPEAIHLSYEDALYLLNRRFFCEQNQHVIGYQQLPDIDNPTFLISPIETDKFCEALCSYIKSCNRSMLVETLSGLEKKLFLTKSDLTNIKLFLTDIYLQVKQTITRDYPTVEIPFPTNFSIIQFIDSKYYLFEIILFFSEQFEMIMNAIGNSSNNSIWDDILQYINHNFRDNIKLETIAPLFGYNSSYLGKMFHKKMGECFNSYIDHVRINHSKELLLRKNMKVYEIAEQVGYNNVDYFHKKFKKYVGESPAEYRKKFVT